MPRLVGGIFVGGRASRMGGAAKGLLPHPRGGRLIDHLSAIVRAVGAEVVLVGDHPDYRELGLPVLSDARPAAGPIGGLIALLERAGDGAALALACDMPYLEEDDLRAVIAAKGDHLAVSPIRGGRLEPFATLYDARALPVAIEREARGERSLLGLLDALDAHAIVLDPSHLRDWDRPEDIT
ncbi:MAG: molybdenum cofactor guanylyltransferase [Sandaracinaceae bacterium]